MSCRENNVRSADDPRHRRPPGSLRPVGRRTSRRQTNLATPNSMAALSFSNRSRTATPPTLLPVGEAKPVSRNSRTCPSTTEGTSGDREYSLVNTWCQFRLYKRCHRTLHRLQEPREREGAEPASPLRSGADYSLRWTVVTRRVGLHVSLWASASSRLATTMPAMNEATPHPMRPIVTTLPDNNRPAPTSTAAVAWSIAVAFTPAHRIPRLKTSRHCCGTG